MSDFGLASDYLLTAIHGKGVLSYGSVGYTNMVACAPDSLTETTSRANRARPGALLQGIELVNSSSLCAKCADLYTMSALRYLTIAPNGTLVIQPPVSV